MRPHFFLLFLLFPLLATAQRQQHAFRVEQHAGIRKQYLCFTYEHSIRRAAVSFSIGGGEKMGWDEQHLSDGEMPSYKSKLLVNNSKTLKAYPFVLPSNSYLEGTKTTYRGVLARLGYAYYLSANNVDRRLSGLYIGADLTGMQMFEHQTLFYHNRRGDFDTEVDGENKYYVVGFAIHTGIQWFPYQGRLGIHAKIAHPFYFPFNEEFNMSSPYVGNSWEGSLGICLRIKA